MFQHPGNSDVDPGNLDIANTFDGQIRIEFDYYNWMIKENNVYFNWDILLQIKTQVYP